MCPARSHIPRRMRTGYLSVPDTHGRRMRMQVLQCCRCCRCCRRQHPPSAGACACVRRLRAPFFIHFFTALTFFRRRSFHPEQALVLASGGYDTTVRLWNVETLKETRTFYGHTGSVTSLAYSAQVCSHMPTHTPRMRLHDTHTHTRTQIHSS